MHSGSRAVNAERGSRHQLRPVTSHPIPAPALTPCLSPPAADMVVSYSRLGLYPQRLFSEVATATTSSMSNFSPPTLADLLEAFAATGHKDPQMLAR
jgi:hypothetical protein